MIVDSTFTTTKQLSKAYDNRYILIDKQQSKPTIGKSCHCLENSIIIFIDHTLVEHFGIRDGTQFEQVLTNEGILLRKIN